MTELLSASLLDMDYHSIKDTANFDIWKPSKNNYGTHRNDSWNHCTLPQHFLQPYFTGGYSAGYYSYTWAEVLDADAYQAFVESGDIYNPKVATAFHKNILEKRWFGWSYEALQNIQRSWSKSGCIIEKKRS